MTSWKTGVAENLFLQYLFDLCAWSLISSVCQATYSTSCSLKLVFLFNHVARHPKLTSQIGWEPQGMPTNLKMDIFDAGTKSCLLVSAISLGSLELCPLVRRCSLCRSLTQYIIVSCGGWACDSNPSPCPSRHRLVLRSLKPFILGICRPRLS